LVSKKTTSPKEQLNNLKKFLYEEYGLNLTDKEVFECYESLYYLAKSIIAYEKYKKGKEK